MFNLSPDRVGEEGKGFQHPLAECRVNLQSALLMGLRAAVAS